MSLDKAIEHGKEKRKAYYGWKSVDPSVRNGHWDSFAKQNREYKNKKEKLKEKDYEDFKE